MTVSEIDAVLFDLGNTLIYFDGEWPAVFAEARRAALNAFLQGGIQVERTSFLNVFRETLEHHYARREDDWVERTMLELLREAMDTLGYQHIPESLLETARLAFYTITQSHWLPEGDCLSTLSALRERGYRMGIISNAADDWDVQTLVDKARVRSYLDFVISSAAFGQRKPSPDIFHAALAHWNIPPARVAMVGDTLHADILGANRMGLYSVWVTRRVPPPHTTPDQPGFHPNLVISTLEQLLPALDSTSRSKP